MKIIRAIGFFMAAVMVLSTMATPAMADRGRGRGFGKGDRQEWKEIKKERYRNDSRRDWKSESRYRKDWHRSERYRDDDRYYYDKRYRHNRYYFKPGHSVKVLPSGYRVVKHRRSHYYYYDGIWYRSGGIGFVVALPPVGLVVPFLPPFYTTVWVRGTPYYYSGGVYYVWDPGERVYVVSEAPTEEEAVPEGDIPDKLFIYPKAGQSKEQQATDRYECHRWSVEETGFDPTKPGGDVPALEHENRHNQYQRAMKACLEARDYSVQ